MTLNELKQVADAGGPAFPFVVETHDKIAVEMGMTLRDYFAAMVMPTVVAKYPQGHERGWAGVAEITYKMADAMLEARKA